MRNVKWFLASALLSAGILFGAGNHVDAASVKIDEKTFPDACVRASVDKYDINKDGILSDEERGKVTTFSYTDLRISQNYKESSKIDFTGMQLFGNIHSLKLDLHYQAAGGIEKEWDYRGDNLSACFPKLESLYLRGNSKTKLDLTAFKNSSLKYLVLENMPAQQMDLTPLSTTKLETLSLEDCKISALNLKPLTKMNLKKLYVINCTLKSIDVSPLKNTLQELWLGEPQQMYLSLGKECMQTKAKYKTLDLSQMKRLKRVYACGIPSLTKVTLKKGSQSASALKELHLYGTAIKSMNASGAIKLQRLFIGDKTSKLNISKCTQLTELGMINNATTNISIKSKSLQHIQYYGKKVKKLSFVNCPKLFSLRTACSTVNTLDLSHNKNLHYLDLSNKKTGKVIYPKVQTKGWSGYYELVDSYFANRYTRDMDIADGVYNVYTGYSSQGAVGTLDVSAWKMMNNYVRKRQITNEYTLHKGKNGVPKKLVINKKLRKADKKWIKKFAKKWHVKVVEK